MKKETRKTVNNRKAMVLNTTDEIVLTAENRNVARKQLIAGVNAGDIKGNIFTILLVDSTLTLHKETKIKVTEE